MKNLINNRRDFLRTIGGAGLFTLTGVSLIGCYHNSSRPLDTTTPPTTSPPSSSGGNVVKMIGAGGQFIFEPDLLVIQPGETVSFEVTSSGHTATAYHPDIRSSSPLRIPEGAAAWDSGILATTGKSWEHTFDIEGVHNYYCLPHEGAGMVGIIVVGRALDGPGLQPLQDSIPLAARNKLQELIDKARNL